jgi:hypothetical protein
VDGTTRALPPEAEALQNKKAPQTVFPDIFS